MIKNIEDWLEKSGYPLELYANKILREKGFQCSKSDLFVDPDTKSSREIDTIAVYWDSDVEGFTVELKLILECKKSEKPLVALNTSDYKKSLFYKTFSRLFGTSFQEISLECLNYLRGRDEKKVCDEIGVCGQVKEVNYSIVQAFKNSDIQIYQGLMSLVKAKHYHSSDFEELFKTIQSNSSSQDDKNLYEVILPILVIDAPLFVARLNSEGKMDVFDSMYEIVDVRRSSSIEDDVSDSVYIVHKDFLDEFITDVLKMYNLIVSEQIGVKALRRAGRLNN